MINYTSGTALNLQDLFIRLQHFLNLQGWNNELDGAPPGQNNEFHFCCSKIIEGQKWFWWFTTSGGSNLFQFAYLTQINSSQPLENQPGVITAKVGNNGSQYEIFNKHAQIDYYFIYNAFPPGENLVVILYQYPVFFTFYLGFLETGITDLLLKNHIQCSDVYGEWSYVHTCLNIYKQEFNDANNYRSYGSRCYLLDRSYNLVLSGMGRSGWRYLGLTTIIPTPLTPVFPIFQPVPILASYTESSLYMIGYLKNLYLTYWAESRPHILNLGNQSFLIVPVKNDTRSSTYIPKEHSYAIRLS